MSGSARQRRHGGVLVTVESGRNTAPSDGSRRSEHISAGRPQSSALGLVGGPCSTCGGPRLVGAEVRMGRDYETCPLCWLRGHGAREPTREEFYYRRGAWQRRPEVVRRG